MASPVRGKNNNNDLCLPFVYDIKRKHSFIKSKADFRELERVLHRALLIGIDTERKPDFAARDLKANPTALIQMAIRTTRDTNYEEFCYIIDIFHMDAPSLSQLNVLLREAFMNPRIIKVGQSLKNDIMELHRCYPHMDGFSKGVCFLDTNDMMKRLTPSLTRLVSLKDMVKTFLHADLIKTCQLSDWTARPLSAEQLHYASCDAVVLLRLYDAMAATAAAAAAAGARRDTNNSSNNGQNRRPRASSTASNVSTRSDASRTHSRSNSFELDDSADINKYAALAEELGLGTHMKQTSPDMDVTDSCHAYRRKTRSMSQQSVSSELDSDSSDGDEITGSHSTEADTYTQFKCIYFSFDFEVEDSKFKDVSSARASAARATAGAVTIVPKVMPVVPLRINKLGVGVTPTSAGVKRKHIRLAENDDGTAIGDGGRDAVDSALKEELERARKARKTEKRLRQKKLKQANKVQQ